LAIALQPAGRPQTAHGLTVTLMGNIAGSRAPDGGRGRDLATFNCKLGDQASQQGVDAAVSSFQGA
jgi:hypothetical protein